MTRRGAHENMWHDIAVQVCFLENLIGDGGGANCDLYRRGLFNLSAALRTSASEVTVCDLRRYTSVICLCLCPSQHGHAVEMPPRRTIADQYDGEQKATEERSTVW